MEVNIVRPFVGRALQAFYKHDSPELIPDQERVLDRRPQVVSNATRVRSCSICLLFFTRRIKSYTESSLTCFIYWLM